MANNIVFQNNAEQLKSSVYGYNSTSKTYEPIQVDSDGQLKVTIGTINYVGTLNKVTAVGTLNKVTSIGTLNKVTAVGTLNKVAAVGTLNKVTSVGTLNKVITVGTLNKVVAVGTLNKVTSVGTLNKVTAVGTLNNIVGTVKVNLVDRTFTATYQNLKVIAGTATYTELIDVSKYQDISWYIRNITNTNNKATVTVQLVATPNKDLANYPRVLMQETATVNAKPKIITNDYYLKYNAVRAILSSGSNQTVVIVFNGRY